MRTRKQNKPSLILFHFAAGIFEFRANTTNIQLRPGYGHKQRPNVYLAA